MTSPEPCQCWDHKLWLHPGHCCMRDDLTCHMEREIEAKTATQDGAT